MLEEYKYEVLQFLSESVFSSAMKQLYNLSLI